MKRSGLYLLAALAALLIALPLLLMLLNSLKSSAEVQGGFLALPREPSFAAWRQAWAQLSGSFSASLMLAVPCLAAFGILRTIVDRLTVRGALIAEELLLMIKPNEARPTAMQAAAGPAGRAVPQPMGSPVMPPPPPPGTMGRKPAPGSAAPMEGVG